MLSTGSKKIFAALGLHFLDLGFWGSESVASSSSFSGVLGLRVSGI